LRVIEDEEVGPKISERKERKYVDKLGIFEGIAG